MGDTEAAVSKGRGANIAGENRAELVARGGEVSLHERLRVGELLFEIIPDVHTRAAVDVRHPVVLEAGDDVAFSRVKGEAKSDPGPRSRAFKRGDTFLVPPRLIILLAA